MDLDERLAGIEGRLEALERRVGVRAASAARERRREQVGEAATAPVAASILDVPVEVPTSAALPPWPTPPPAAPVPHALPRRVASPREARARAQRLEARRGADLERFVGVAVLGRVGIAAILLAAAWFAQLAYQAFPPAWRVGSIEGLALALAGVGFVVRAKVSTRFLAILWGGATAAAYMAGVVARVRYGIVGPVEAAAMLVAACALGQALAKTAGVRALAHVALVGAFAAPFLVGAPTDMRTSLLVYVLVLHGWAAFTEARWGWRGARVLSVVGGAVVALAWAAAHGGTDVSTCLHLQLYLVGFTAPEWIAALRGRDAEPRRATVAFALLLAAAVAALAAFAVQGPADLTRGFPLVAGAFWLLLAAVVRLRAGEATPSVRGIARVGEVLLVAAAITAWPTEWAEGVREPAILAGLAAAGVAFAALRSRLGTGSLAALLAMSATLVVLGSRAAPDPWLAVALAAPAALVLLGAGPFRPLGLAAGVAAFGIALARAPEPWWQALAFTGACAWLAGGYALAARRRDDLGRVAAEVLWIVACFLWAWASLEGLFAPVAPALWNPGTFAALALALVPWIRRRAGVGPDSEQFEGSLRIVLWGLLLGAAWREWHAAAGSVSALALAEWHATAFLTAAAAVVLAAGRGRLSAVHRVLAGALFLAAHGAVLAHASMPGSAWGFAWELALLVGPAALLARAPVGPGRAGWPPLLALLPAAIWAVAALGGRLDGGALFLANARFLSAALVTAALAALRLRDAGGPRATILGVAAALVGYAGGLGETLDAVAHLDSPTLRHALVSVYSAFAAAVVLAIGFVRRAPDLRWLALVGFGAVIAKVGLHDLADAGTSVRIFVTGVLGVVLLVSAYAYARREPAAAIPAGSEAVDTASARASRGASPTLGG